MKKLSKTLFTCVVLAVAVAFGSGCPFLPPPHEFVNANVVRGGLLYDKWWDEAELPEPTGDHPLWSTRPDTTSNSRTGKDTWRCKECHGWDYKGVDGAYGSGSHRTGFAGIFGVAGADIRAKAARDVFYIIKTDHSYSTVLSDEDIWDLTKFALEGQLDTDDIIDNSDAFIGDSGPGQTIYANNCAACHGADGLTPPPGAGPGFDEYPGKIADENPWEMQHKTSYGQPGTAMFPQAGTLSVQQIGDLGAYLQTLPIAPPPDEFLAANVVRGGLLYDKWWEQAELPEPTGDHPLWSTRPDTSSNSRTGKDTWRCKECHGWDYKGVDGAYGSGSHRTGFAGIFGVVDADIRAKAAQDVFDVIKTAHSYNAVLSDEDIWDLTKFVLEGQLDTDDIIDGTSNFIGDSGPGQTIYANNCAACHGADGLTPPPGAGPGFDEYPGKIADENPWEMQHKTSYGQPGTAMFPQAGTLSVQQIGDLGAYLQTLPIAPPPDEFLAANVVRGGLLYDKWWEQAELPEPTGDHPLWSTRPDTSSNSRTGKDTWRCKECHGWDYKGVDGAYGSGSHRTGFAGIFGVAGADIRAKAAQDILDVFDVIKTNHSYNTVLSDEDIWDLTKFVLQGQLDTDDIIDGTGNFIGDGGAGLTIYGTSCGFCHGADGLTPPPGADLDFGDYPGKVADENPWEMQHKISFGQPGTAMPAQAAALNVEQIGDLGVHLQSLPTAKP